MENLVSAKWLERQIMELEEELECPVCLEVAIDPPIFKCPNEHLICRFTTLGGEGGRGVDRKQSMKFCKLSHSTENSSNIPWMWSVTFNLDVSAMQLKCVFFRICRPKS